LYDNLETAEDPEVRLKVRTIKHLVAPRPPRSARQDDVVDAVSPSYTVTP
jgi:hypothetical protein